MVLNMRNTKQRKLILDNLRQRRDHPTAEGVYESLHREQAPVSLATVYRNLARLSEEGLILSLPDLGEGRRFDGQTAPHHHFFCSSCGRVFDLEFELPSSLKESVFRKIPGEVTQLQLQLHGICNQCLAQKDTGGNTQ